MKISEMIKRLQRRFELYGDANVVFRDSDGKFTEDIDIFSLYFDEEAERLVISNGLDPFDE